jgi:hypothetical protein
MTDLVGQLTLSSATEGVALASNTTVATFTDTNSTDVAVDFTATIDWGDGVTTSGTVVSSASPGVFFVTTSGHTYADEGSFQTTVTITRTTDQTQFVLPGTVTVTESDVLTEGAPLQPILGNPGQALTNVVVANFVDSNTSNVAGDFTATIDWGDGTTSSGTVSSAAPGTFQVSGSHTYAAAGQFRINASITDDAPGTASTNSAITFTGADAVIGLSTGGNGLTGRQISEAGWSLPSPFGVTDIRDSNRLCMRSPIWTPIYETD